MKISHVKNTVKSSVRYRLVLKLMVGRKGLVLSVSPLVLLALLGSFGFAGRSWLVRRNQAEIAYQDRLHALEEENHQMQTFLARKELEKRQMVTLAESRSDQLLGELKSRDEEMEQIWRAVGKKGGASEHRLPILRRHSLAAARMGDYPWQIKRRFLELSSDIRVRDREMVVLRQAAARFRVARHRRIRAVARMVALSTVPSIWPTQGGVSSPFGYRMHPILGYARFHSGMDICASYGQPIVATASGRCTSAGWMSGYGIAVTIEHGGGLSTLYGHCSSVSVSPGQMVQQGQLIANVGSTGMSTGPHCHYEVRVHGNPVNPAPYLRSIR
jgi:murein DD-endopeptidase MepM/ murein hydrolase activator NlpD